MKLKRFKERDNERIGVIIFTLVCIFLISGAILYRTFAIFEVNTTQNVIKGTVQDPGDIYFAFYVDNKIQKDLPSKDSGYIFNSQASYCGVNGGKDESIIPWFDKEEWSVTVTGMKTSRTKCNLYFEKGENLKNKISSLATVEEGDGLYRVTHEDAEITYTEEVEKQNMLKQEELRYAGSSPNNFVWFNHELWRMIGLVNTPEGQRIKLVKGENIGSYSWDVSEVTENNGYGYNDWETSEVKILLNDYYYFNKANQTCYQLGIAQNNQYIYKTTTCSFEARGLKKVPYELENVSWNIGAVLLDSFRKEKVSKYYEMERSNTCPGECNGKEMTWQGYVGLMNASDYGYAVGGTKDNRDTCFNTPLYNWNNCDEENWIWTVIQQGCYLMTSVQGTTVLSINSNKYITEKRSSNNSFIYPVIYLKEDVLVSSNSLGTADSPYIID